MKKIISLFVLLTICTGTPFAFAPEVTEDDTFYVKLNFDANKEDTGLKNQTRSYLKNELRRLGNIVFTEENFEYEFSFFVFEPRLKDGAGTGIVIVSVIVTKSLPDNRPLFVADTLKWGNRKDLRTLCTALVKQINDELIERKRGVRKKATGL
jgi:hypothetical protein